MQFKQGTHVYTQNGNDVGEIDRVVLDPQTDEVTHVVVRKGWLFTEDKVVPIDLIDKAVADQIQLRADVTNLDDLPEFEERYYVPPNEASDEALSREYDPAEVAPSLYWYPPIGSAWAGYYNGYYAYPQVPYVVHSEQNIPEGTIGLKEGARVVSSDDENVGNVERIFTNNELNRATHLLIAAGWLFKERRLIPVDWIRTVNEDEIDLAVTASTLEKIPAYQGEPS